MPSSQNSVELPWLCSTPLTTSLWNITPTAGQGCREQEGGMFQLSGLGSVIDLPREEGEYGVHTLGFASIQ